MAWTYGLYFVLLISLLHGHLAQTISTSTPLPPLQWLNITNLLTGPAPPPLKDSTIAYDDTTRSLVIFGGESEGGFVQSQTYLLNLNTLTWSIPNPPVTLMSTPAPRSAALGGDDLAASNRNGFVVIGGKGSDGLPLSDVWEYDFTNQFWSEVMLSPGGPSARWGASGGIDFRTPPIQDPVIPGPNNTFYLAGGFDGSSPSPLSDIWTLTLSGTLSSNMPNTSMGSWANISFGSLPSKVNQASTMLYQQIVVAGGCDTANISNNTCAQQDSFIIDTNTRVENSPNPCPAPRFGATLVPNLNTFSPTFSSQAFLLLGTFNTSLWQDNGGLEKGEVAILDTNTGSWSRVLPSGDPGAGAVPVFPTPRDGAAAFAYQTALVGDSRSSSSDTIIFGGQDASGNYLSEVWLLRAYRGTITQSNASWSGFGDGRLQTGINANGAGVTIQYMSTCAAAISPSTSGNSSNVPSTPPSEAAPSDFFLFDTALSHKLLSPLSLALLLPSVIIFRLSSPAYNPGQREHTLVNTAAIVVLATYVLGVAGLATSFTTITSSKTVDKRSLESLSSHIALRTLHGQAGLALFVGLYAFIPVLLLSASLCRSHDIPKNEKNEKVPELRPRANSTDTTGILSSNLGHGRSAPQSIDAPSRTSTPRSRLPSFSGFWRRSNERRMSADSESVLDAPPQQGFEVLNRPSRTRTTTGNSSTWLTVPMTESRHITPLPISAASLRNVDWLRRRRVLNEVGDLDYTLTQAHRSQPQAPNRVSSATPTILTLPHPEMPSWPEAALRIVLHALLLGSSILTLFALWSRAPRTWFAIFLAWTLSFYLSVSVLAWHGKPHRSIMTVVMSKTRALTTIPSPPNVQQPCTAPDNNGVPFPTVPFPTASNGPYVHRPPYRATFLSGQDDVVPVGPRSVETDSDDNDDEDEDTRQRVIEDEMGRREVSIVTVPKRKLCIANPS